MERGAEILRHEWRSSDDKVVIIVAVVAAVGVGIGVGSRRAWYTFYCIVHLGATAYKGVGANFFRKEQGPWQAKRE